MIRKKYINVKDKVIVFDEGHNIEAKAEDMYSYEVSQEDLLSLKSLGQ